MKMASSQIRKGVLEAGGGSRPLVLWPHGIDANETFYFPDVSRGIDYFVVSSAMRARYRLEPARFVRQLEFYDWLDEVGRVAVSFAPEGLVTGPHLTIYDLSEQAREPATFAPLLWLSCLPAEFMSELGDRLGQQGQKLQVEDFPPEIWPRVLGEPYVRFMQPFQLKMARNLADLGRPDHALAYAEAVIAMNPGYAPAANLGAWCAHKLGRTGQAADLARRCLEAGPRPVGLAENLRWYVEQGQRP